MFLRTGLVQGSLDMLVLRILARGELHGHGIAGRISQISRSTLKLSDGSLYPALYRMAAKGWIKSVWGPSENNRKAKFYSLTKAGRKQLETEHDGWEKVSAIIAEIMQKA